jgi:ankyrin repeat protein
MNFATARRKLDESSQQALLIDALSERVVKKILSLGKEGRDTSQIAHAVQNIFLSVSKPNSIAKQALSPRRSVSPRRSLKKMMALELQTSFPTSGKLQDQEIALCEACTKGDVESVRFLLKDGNVSVNCLNGDGLSPLMIAAADGNGNLVKALLATEHINVNQVDKDGDDTAIMLAVEGGHYDVVSILLRHGGIDLKHEDRFGENCLTLARIHRRYDISLILKEAMSHSSLSP